MKLKAILFLTFAFITLLSFGTQVAAQESATQYGTTFPVNVPMYPNSKPYTLLKVPFTTSLNEIESDYNDDTKSFTYTYLWPNTDYTEVTQWYKTELEKDGWSSCGDSYIDEGDVSKQYILNYRKQDGAKYHTLFINASDTSTTRWESSTKEGPTHLLIRYNEDTISCDDKDNQFKLEFNIVDDHQMAQGVYPENLPIYPQAIDAQQGTGLTPAKIVLTGRDLARFDGVDSIIYGRYWIKEDSQTLLKWYQDNLTAQGWERCSEVSGTSRFDKPEYKNIYKLKQANGNYLTAEIYSTEVHPYGKQFDWGPYEFSVTTYESSHACGEYKAPATGSETKQQLTENPQMLIGIGIGIIILGSLAYILAKKRKN
ncbi:MAG: hypothetical protein ACEQSA_02300 [Weeksellaceae bacterium]